MVVAAMPAMMSTTSQRGTMPTPTRSAPIELKFMSKEGKKQPTTLPTMAMKEKMRPTFSTSGSFMTRMSTSMPMTTKNMGTKKL